MPRPRGSCDTCKRRKVRCTSPTSNNGSCKTCLLAKLPCTYTGNFKNRVISKDYIERLESRLSELESLLNQTQSSSSPSSSTAGHALLNNPETLGIFKALPPHANASGAKEEELELSDADDCPKALQQSMSALNVSPRFHGRSSSSKLVSDIFEHERTNTTTNPMLPSKRTSPSVLLYKRPEYWSPFPWETEPDISFNFFAFPEKDLFDSLVGLYFEQVNYMYALLHRPTFEALVAEGIHYRDPQFANVVLLVLAIGSRFSTDPRVVLEGTGSWLSAGWKWFSQVNPYNKSTMSVPRLFNLQTLALYTIYIQDCPSHEDGWSLISAGLRLAQASGAHRRKVYSSKLTGIDEQWKRAFWCLYILDRQLSLTLGRPCSLHDEDFDVDLPIDCDDEYWMREPNLDFEQPPEKPSKIAFVICFIQANFVLSYALRTIYATSKSKAFLGYTGQGWEERLVADLDSKINSWEAKIPSHLRFSATVQDPLFFFQAATLSSVYHDLRLLVHHPFVAPGGKSTSISHSCLASCDNAARANSRIATIVSRRLTTGPAPHLLLHTAFTSAIVLFFKLFSARRSRTVIDMPTIMAGVHGCMRVLENAESRTWAAGQHRDILCNLAALGDLPLYSTLSPPSQAVVDPTLDTFAFFEPSNVQLMPDLQTSNNNIQTSMFQESQPSMLDIDEQLRNMWNDAPLGMGFDLNWDSYIDSLNWMSSNSQT
ncbi:fungal-specific transcription factor domain-containing protein [Lentinula raphanica]|uniref:Fungal-specific transcription factor domain-containing protein n=1 Tax=Lentinula raphanica TaxID=153919 RepID=A0AA38P5E9_9AGAR|nr:fungal-specific transcription factor domain-containing protein [Lentinula raphanica]